MDKDSHKQEYERYKAEIKTLNNEIDKLRSQNRALNAAISVE
jgi:cell division protein FtsB